MDTLNSGQRQWADFILTLALTPTPTPTLTLTPSLTPYDQVGRLYPRGYH